MNKNENQIVSGMVLEALPNTMFRVEFENGEIHIAYLSGKMKRFNIRVLVGDKVKVELDRYGGKGKIIQRL